MLSAREYVAAIAGAIEERARNAEDMIVAFMLLEESID